VRLYDEYLRRPDLIRLATWACLERSPTGHLVDDADRLDDHKLRAIAEAQAADVVRPGDPFDVMAMVIAMSMAWPPVSNRGRELRPAPRLRPGRVTPAEAHARRSVSTVSSGRRARSVTAVATGPAPASVRPGPSAVMAAIAELLSR
jgi:hypothetical protein